jgi:hypothetical protein
VRPLLGSAAWALWRAVCLATRHLSLIAQAPSDSASNNGERIPSAGAGISTYDVPALAERLSHVLAPHVHVGTQAAARDTPRVVSGLAAADPKSSPLVAVVKPAPAMSRVEKGAAVRAWNLQEQARKKAQVHEALSGMEALLAEARSMPCLFPELLPLLHARLLSARSWQARATFLRFCVRAFALLLTPSLMQAVATRVLEACDAPTRLCSRHQLDPNKLCSAFSPEALAPPPADVLFASLPPPPPGGDAACAGPPAIGASGRATVCVFCAGVPWERLEALVAEGTALRLEMPQLTR